MQLVNTIEIPFENRRFVDRMAHAFGNTLVREITGNWHRLRRACFERSATQRPCAAPDAIDLPGYYGGAYHRMVAATPILSCSAVVGADPFQQETTSTRCIIAAQKKKAAPRSHRGDDIWLDILRADPALPARMM